MRLVDIKRTYKKHSPLYGMRHGNAMGGARPTDPNPMSPIEDPPFSSLLPFVLAPLQKSPTATNRRYEV
jgi:hypothetical protein